MDEFKEKLQGRVIYDPNQFVAERPFGGFPETPIWRTEASIIGQYTPLGNWNFPPADHIIRMIPVALQCGENLKC